MTHDLSQAAGRRLRDDVDVAEDAPSNYALGRRGLIERAASERAARRRGQSGLRACLLAASVVLLLATGYAGFESWRARGSGFVAGESAQSGRVGAYYGANAGVPLGLRFEDGSRIRVQEHGGLRVADMGATNVAVQLETGSARFDIVPQVGKSWDVFAGPYRVRVTGTAFSLSWNVPEQSLALQMHSGAVIVSGPGIESGQRVSGAERFVSRVTSARTAPVGDATNAAPVELAGRIPAKSPSEAAAASSEATPKAAPVTTVGPLTSRGAASDTQVPSLPSKPEPSSVSPGPAAPVLEAQAAEQVLAGGSSDQLLALADSARFSGRVDLAERALRAVRQRFAGSPAAASSAFLLGKMAQDAGNLASAASLYDSHIRESGQLVPEASGRKMLVLHRLGNSAGARAAAQEYLERFPEGPYARQARELLSR
jgi:TolA-binding protein